MLPENDPCYLDNDGLLRAKRDGELIETEDGTFKWNEALGAWEPAEAPDAGGE